MDSNENSLIGKTVLNYRIIEVLGRGGMGVVYKGEHVNLTGQYAAIKMIRADRVNNFTRQQMRDEAQNLSQMHHNNIVTFYDYHVDSDGNVFLIMEYADGMNINEYIGKKTGLIVQDRIGPIFDPILDAVGYAHKRNVLHRDIKPSNIIITEEGRPMILDFGISKLINQDNDGADSTEDVVAGTPSYMSPEQVQGKKLDNRSDIYALGVVLHQMLTGTAPYDTKTMSEFDISRAVVNQPLPRMKTYYKYISEGLQRVVDKATEKDPDKRYKSCEEFKRDFDKVVYPDINRRKRVISIAAACTLLVSVGLGCFDFFRTKTFFYKDYAEEWSVPVGIGRVSKSNASHMCRVYRFEKSQGKVRRVTHVNGYGKAIPDGESERVERPIDQLISYSSDGKVNRIKVLDQCGKVLYVKAFNEELNTMVFQYDDEHNTEHVIGNQTIGYEHAFVQEGSNKGRISRWWIQYDNEGHATRIQYASLDNQNVGDDNHIFGREMKYDSKGRVVEVSYIGKDGAPKNTKWGLGKKRFYYDANNNWVKAEYLTIDDKPAYDAADGVCVFELEYDKTGNLVRAFHKESDGALMIPKRMGYSGVEYSYDNHGNITKAMFLGVDGNAMFVASEGFAGYLAKYDNNGFVAEHIFIDQNSNPVITSAGNSKRTCVCDEHGNTLEVWNYDLNDNLVLNQNAFAGMKFKYDSVGNEVERVFYGVDEKPCKVSGGYAGERMLYNDRNQLIEDVYLDQELNPTISNNNISIARYEYDNKGNLTKISFFDTKGQNLVLSNEDVAGWKISYDDHGNEIERVFFNTKKEICRLYGRSYARITHEYDSYGNEKSERYYNENGQLMLVNGVAGYDYICDERGNILSSLPLGTDNKQASNKLEVRYKYDKFDNEVECAYFDKGKPATNYKGIHRVEQKYDSKNQCIEMRNYGTNGQLVLSKGDKGSCEGYAIIKYEYDERGNVVRNAFLGVDGKPIKNTQGWSSSYYERDIFGNATKQCFYDVNGQPTDPKDMVPVGVCEYDKYNNLTYLAAQDGSGHYIMNPLTGWSICRWGYNEKSKCVSVAYFDEKDKPMNCREGYSKILYSYDKQDHPTEVAYYGITGNLVNSNEGYARKVMEYDSTGIQIYEKYYDANGTLLLSVKYDKKKEEWIPVGGKIMNGGGHVQQSNWKKVARELSYLCPVEIEDGVWLNAVVISDNSVNMRIQLKEISLYDIDSDTKAQLKQALKQLQRELREAIGAPNSVSVNVTLQDKAFRTIATI